MRNRSFSYERAATMDEEEEEEDNTDDAGEEDDWYHTANGDDPNAQRIPIVASSSSSSSTSSSSEAKRTLRNFILMSILFSANHGCVVGKELSYESIENPVVPTHEIAYILFCSSTMSIILPKTNCICFFLFFYTTKFHYTLIACLALATSRLGVATGAWQSGILYSMYTVSSILGSTYIVKKLGPKQSVVVGMVLLCAYVGCFYSVATLAEATSSDDDNDATTKQQQQQHQQFYAYLGAGIGT